MKIEQIVDLKTKLLINGINFNEDVSQSHGFKKRTEHLYRHDHGYKVTFSYPQEIAIKYDHDTSFIINVRYNENSSWHLICNSNKLYIKNEDFLLEVQPLLEPEFYSQKYDEVEFWNYAQLMGEDLVGLVTKNSCHYFGIKKECTFCEIVPAFIQSDKKNYKKSNEILSTVLNSTLEDSVIKNVLLTSGNAQNNNDVFIDYLSIIEKSKSQILRRNIYVLGLLMPPDDFSFINRLGEGGFSGVSFNLEVWGDEQFRIITPGKSDYGKAKIIEALKYAKDVFGVGNVYSNLIYGIQSLKNGSYNPEVENNICLLATRELLKIGIVPLFTIYHTTDKNKIGKVNLDQNFCIDFFKKYAQLVLESNVIPSTRNSILFNLSSVTNHPYNDYFYLKKYS